MIILAIPCLLRGGTEFQTLQLLKVLKGFQKEVSVLIFFEVDPDMFSTFQREGAKVICLNWDRSIKPWTFVRKFAEVLKSNRPDVLHVQYMAPGALPIFAAKLAGVPRIIATVHQPYTQSHGKSAKLILRTAALFCRPFLAVSQNAERSWFGSSQLINPAILIYKQAKHLTLYNTVDVERLQRIVKANKSKTDLKFFGIPEGTLVIGAVSRLRHEKGIDLLIQAFAEVGKDSSIPLKLLLVGDGPDRKKLEVLATDLGCLEHVIFSGSADWNRAMQLMAQMDMVVVPSRFEGFGLTAAEAMGMGKALIVSDSFGLKELVDHELNGLIFSNREIDSLKKSLEKLITDSDLRSNFGKQAFQKTKESFDLPVFERNIKNLYQI